MWLRQGRSWLIAVVGVVSLIGFALTLTRVDAGFAGRAYAAYGGVYIAASLAWLWTVEGQRPTAADLLGATLAVAVPWCSSAPRRGAPEHCFRSRTPFVTRGVWAFTH